MRSSRLSAGLALALATLSSALAAADMRTLIPHVGRLYAPDDRPVEGKQTLLFHLYEKLAPTSPDEPEIELWSATYEVDVTKGLYAVTLGSGVGIDPIPPAALPAGRDVYLQITVAGQKLTPRLRLSAVPAAVDTLRLGGRLADEYALAANVYPKAETYTKSEVYAKGETYPKEAVFTKEETWAKDDVYPKTDVFSKGETYPRALLYTKEESYAKSEVFEKGAADARFARVDGTAPQAGSLSLVGSGAFGGTLSATGAASFAGAVNVTGAVAAGSVSTTDLTAENASLAANAGSVGIGIAAPTASKLAVKGDAVFSDGKVVIAPNLGGLRVGNTVYGAYQLALVTTGAEPPGYSANPLHIKTNWTCGVASLMYNLHFQGHLFMAGKEINIIAVGYLYGANGHTYRGITQVSGGVSGASYCSAVDSKLVFKLTAETNWHASDLTIDLIGGGSSYHRTAADTFQIIAAQHSATDI